MKLFLDLGKKFCFRVAPLLKSDSATASRPPLCHRQGVKRYSACPNNQDLIRLVEYEHVRFIY